MRNDSEIYNRIGEILMGAAPEGARKIIARAKLSKDLDSCEYEYDYIDEQGEASWFTVGGRVNTEMLSLLVELRCWYVENNLAAGLPVWDGCEITINLEEVKIAINFIYS
jgi:hypothetical protein